MLGSRGTFLNYDTAGDEDLESIHTCELDHMQENDVVCTCGTVFHMFIPFDDVSSK